MTGSLTSGNPRSLLMVYALPQGQISTFYLGSKSGSECVCVWRIGETSLDEMVRLLILVLCSGLVLRSTAVELWRSIINEIILCMII